jgi:hypothetical protein
MCGWRMKTRYKSADFRKPPKRDESSVNYASAGIEQDPHPVTWQ